MPTEKGKVVALKPATQKQIAATLSVDPWVEIELQGRKRKLEFNARALINILRETGINLIVDGFGARAEHLQDPTKLTHILHQGLLKHSPELTYDDCMDLFSIKHTVYIWSRLTEAMQIIRPQQDEVEQMSLSETETDPTKGPTPIGSISTQ